MAHGSISGNVPTPLSLEVLILGAKLLLLFGDRLCLDLLMIRQDSDFNETRGSIKSLVDSFDRTSFEAPFRDPM